MQLAQFLKSSGLAALAATMVIGAMPSASFAQDEERRGGRGMRHGDGGVGGGGQPSPRAEPRAEQRQEARQERPAMRQQTEQPTFRNERLERPEFRQEARQERPEFRQPDRTPRPSGNDGFRGPVPDNVDAETYARDMARRGELTIPQDQRANQRREDRDRERPGREGGGFGQQRPDGPRGDAGQPPVAERPDATPRNPTYRSEDRNRTYADRNRDRDNRRDGDRNDRDRDRDNRGDWNRDRDNRGDWNHNDRDRQDWNRGNNHGSWDRDRNHRRWDRSDWRRDRRYDWNRHRTSNRHVFHLGRYYSPYRSYSYRRLNIGFYLSSGFYGNRYWINDPWQYRLPDVYGPYRWVRYYDDVLLVDIYSGEVVDVIYDFFW